MRCAQPDADELWVGGRDGAHRRAVVVVWPVAGLLDAVQAAAERQRQWNADGTPRRHGALDERLTDDAAITDALEALSGLAGADVAADSRLAVGDRLRALRGDAATLAGCRSCTACGGRSTTLV